MAQVYPKWPSVARAGRAVWRAVWRRRLLVTGLLVLACAAGFGLSLRLPPLYETEVVVEVAADVGPLPPGLLHPGAPPPSAAELERAYYAQAGGALLSRPFAERLAKHLEAHHGWRVVAPGTDALSPQLLDQLSQAITVDKRGEREVIVRIRHRDAAWTRSLGQAVRELLREEGPRFFAGGPAVRSVRVTVDDAPAALRPPGPARRTLEGLVVAAATLTVGFGAAVVLRAAVGHTGVRRAKRRTASAAA